MELHAWINPFRVAVSLKKGFAENHILFQHPEWVITYNNQAYLDPGQPLVRHYVCQVAKDIVSHYSIDALHIDDYFYPYPVSGIPFNDEATFQEFGLSEGFSYQEKADWRRENINLFIEELRETINQVKPWLPIGISPFGIYRNKQNFKKGSNTKGLEGYEALYADVLLWAKNGWIDYITPQIYWNIGNPSADYRELVQWWGKQDIGKAALFIGQDIRKTTKGQQLSNKIILQRKFSGGDFWWPADDLWKDYQSINTDLKNFYFDSPILPPPSIRFKKKRAEKIKEIYWKNSSSESILFWENSSNPLNPKTPRFYVVYGLLSSSKRKFPDQAVRLSISSQAFFKIPLYANYKGFAVTAVNFYNNESRPCFFFFDKQ